MGNLQGAPVVRQRTCALPRSSITRKHNRPPRASFTHPFCLPAYCRMQLQRYICGCWWTKRFLLDYTKVTQIRPTIRPVPDVCGLIETHSCSQLCNQAFMKAIMIMLYDLRTIYFEEKEESAWHIGCQCYEDGQCPCECLPQLFYGTVDFFSEAVG